MIVLRSRSFKRLLQTGRKFELGHIFHKIEIIRNQFMDNGDACQLLIALARTSITTYQLSITSYENDIFVVLKLHKWNKSYSIENFVIDFDLLQQCL